MQLARACSDSEAARHDLLAQSSVTSRGHEASPTRRCETYCPTAAVTQAERRLCTPYSLADARGTEQVAVRTDV